VGEDGGLSGSESECEVAHPRFRDHPSLSDPDQHGLDALAVQANAFTTTGANCHSNADNSCIYSDHSWTNYQNGQMCQYIVNSAVTLQVNRFVTESCCDKLRVQGTYYSGSNYGGLQGLQLNPGEVMRWQTDHSVIYRGFEICGNAALPPHPTGIPGAYTVSSGPCHTNSDGSCFYTPNYPSHYGNNQDCNIQVNLPTGLDVVAFDTESGYDRLTLHGTIYQGNGAGLQGVTMAAGETMQFHTDGSVLRSGFAICSGTLSTNSPTTVAPTTSPTTSSPTTATPTVSPSSAAPSVSPTKNPTSAPTESPTAHPTSQAPSESPTESPTLAPSAAPSAAPTLPLVKMVLNGTPARNLGVI
jgi:hypothetical protein